MNNETVSFVTRTGNKYIYDNNSGQIFCEMGAGKREQISEFKKRIGQYANPPIEIITESKVNDFLMKNGYKQLQLEVTTGCNLRCKYCCFSECYEYTRSHGTDMMSWDVAQKAIDEYYSNFKIVKQNNPSRNACVSFYGGEPLLNFKLIKQVVEYISKKYSMFHTDYNITTNGTLLDDKIGDFLVKNNFAVLISLDGDKETQDRNRVFANGGGTFDVVIKNLRSFRKKHPGYPKLAISACYDPTIDFEKVEQFFNEEKLLVAKHAFIDGTNTTYFDRFTPADWEKFNNNKRKFKDRYILAVTPFSKDEFISYSVGVGYMEFAFHIMYGDKRNSITPYSGTCVPGEKMYVSTDGTVHMCEKVNPRYSIGNVNSGGLDAKKIADITNEYNREISTHCRNCEISKLCSLCFKAFGGADGFVYDENICNTLREHVRETLSEYAELLEKRPQEVERITGEYYGKVMEVVGEGC